MAPSHEVDGDGVAGRAVVGVDHDLQGPARAVAAAIRAQAQLGIANRVGMAGLPRHKAGKAFAAALDQVEPGMFAERRVRVGLARSVQKAGDSGKVFTVEVTHDPDIVHVHEASLVGVPYSSPEVSRPAAAKLAAAAFVQSSTPAAQRNCAR